MTLFAPRCVVALAALVVSASCSPGVDEGPFTPVPIHPFFEDAVLQLKRRHPRLRFVLVSASTINLLDASGIEMLSALQEGLRKNGTALVFSGVNPGVREALERTGLVGRIGAENFFADDTAAFTALAGRPPGSAIL